MIRERLEIDIELQVPGFMLHLQFSLGRQLGVLFGRSGAGKSLSLRAIAGLIKPQAGIIRLNQRMLFDHQAGINLPPQARRIGYLPQNQALFPHRTIAQNIAYGLHDLSHHERSQQVQKWIEIMNLQDQAGKLPSEVSGGQQQRTALARAMAVKPDLLLMDEPFVALDESLRDHLRGEVQRVQAETNTPILLVTHDIGEAYQLADHLIVIADGRVIQTGARDDVFRHPRDASVARLMGMTNLLRVTSTADRTPLGLRRLLWGVQPLAAKITDASSPGEEITIGIRPEDILFIRADHPLDTDLEENLMEVELIEDRSQGFDHLVCTQLIGQPEKQLLVRIPHPVFIRMQLSIGDRRQISIRPPAIHYIAQDNRSA
ncbi:MAG: ABC transporter ATP-binding protein [Anaerolineales bacterium]